MWGRPARSERQIHGYITTGQVVGTGAGMGAWMGGIFGPLLVAGPLAAARLGGILNAVLRGLRGDAAA